MGFELRLAVFRAEVVRVTVVLDRPVRVALVNLHAAHWVGMRIHGRTSSMPLHSMSMRLVGDGVGTPRFRRREFRTVQMKASRTRRDFAFTCQGTSVDEGRFAAMATP